MRGLKDLVIAAILVFAPIQATLVTVMVLCVVDLLTGILAARKRGERITSAQLKRTPIKIAVYEVSILCAHLVSEYLTPTELPVMSLVTGLIGMVELKSVLENMDVLLGGPTFSVITSKIQQLASKKLEKQSDDESNPPSAPPLG